jgi:hypothetical protein
MSLDVLAGPRLGNRSEAPLPATILENASAAIEQELKLRNTQPETGTGAGAN